MGELTASEKKAQAIKEMIAEQSEVKNVATPTEKGKKAKS